MNVDTTKKELILKPLISKRLLSLIFPVLGISSIYIALHSNVFDFRNFYLPILLGLILITAWIFIIFSYPSISLVLNENGITCKNRKGRMFYDWNDITDIRAIHGGYSLPDELNLTLGHVGTPMRSNWTFQFSAKYGANIPNLYCKNIDDLYVLVSIWWSNYNKTAPKITNSNELNLQELSFITIWEDEKDKRNTIHILKIWISIAFFIFFLFMHYYSLSMIAGLIIFMGGSLWEANALKCPNCLHKLKTMSLITCPFCNQLLVSNNLFLHI